MQEFAEGQSVRVLEEGGTPGTQPDRRFLGQEGTIQSIQYGTGTLPDGLPTFFHVEFDSVWWMDKVMAISADWIEHR